MATYVDLSHSIQDGMITFKGSPGPVICDYLSREASQKNYSEGTEFQIGRIDLVSNTGIYIDCPFHRYAYGKDLNDTVLARFVNFPGVVVRVPHRDGIEVDVRHFEDVDIRGRAVLVHRMGRALGHGAVLRRPSYSHAKCGRVPARSRRGAGRDRLAQH